MSAPIEGERVEIRTRFYHCYSKVCAGGVSGVDAVPKPHGQPAVCWMCDSDLYTMPRFGAPADHIPPEQLKRTIISPLSIPRAANPAPPAWAQTFANLWAGTPQSSSSSESSTTSASMNP